MFAMYLTYHFMCTVALKPRVAGCFHVETVIKVSAVIQTLDILYDSVNLKCMMEINHVYNTQSNFLSLSSILWLLDFVQPFR